MNNGILALIAKGVAGTRASLAPFNVADCYVSPYGSDETGDGSFENPWYTFVHTPANSHIGMLPGVYDSADYGIVVGLKTNAYENYCDMHGLFISPWDTSRGASISSRDRKDANGSLDRTLDDPTYVDTYGVKIGTTFFATHGPGTVEIRLTGIVQSRDTNVFVGGNFIFKDIDIFYKRSLTVAGSQGYKVALCRWTAFGMILNSNIEVGGQYSYIYYNGGSVSDATIFKDVTFSGNRQLLSSYSGFINHMNTIDV